MTSNPANILPVASSATNASVLIIPPRATLIMHAPSLSVASRSLSKKFLESSLSGITIKTMSYSDIFESNSEMKIESLLPLLEYISTLTS